MFDINDEKIPDWMRKMVIEQNFSATRLPKLQRKKSSLNEYFVYSDKEEFKLVEAETAVDAAQKSEIENPYKVVPAHKRIADVLQNEDLEYVENDDKYDTNASEGEAEEQPAAEAQPAEATAEPDKPAE